MLDKLVYINSKGQKVEFGGRGIIINTNNIRDYEWIYTAVSEKIAKFKRTISNKTLPVLFYGTAAGDTANEVHKILDYDVVNNTAGRLYSGDYYVQGFFIGSTKTSYTQSGILKMDLIFITDTSVWIKEKKQAYRYLAGADSEFLDYPHDMNYDYYIGGRLGHITNDSVAAADFKMIIYGNNTDSIEIRVGLNRYIIFENLKKGEYITIDSKARKLYKTDKRGNVTNIFNSRSRIYPIFKKIPSGRLEVAWDLDLDFDITLFEERSEPLWI